MDRIICLMSKGNQCCSGQAALFIAECIRVEVVDYIRCNESEAEGNRPSDQNADRARAAGIRGVPVWAPVVAWKCKNGFYDKFWVQWNVLLTSLLHTDKLQLWTFKAMWATPYPSLLLFFGLITIRLTFLWITFRTTCNNIKTQENRVTFFKM